MWRGPLLALVLGLPQPALAQKATDQPPPRTVTLSPADLSPLPGTAREAAAVEAPEIPDTVPVVTVQDTGPAARQLKGLVRTGRAAGLAGVLYDNRDRGHSRLSLGRFPQITPIVYDDALKGQRRDWGLGGRIAWDPVVIGNSSTAYKRGSSPRSLARYAMTVAPWPWLAWESYVSNEIYVYPEHEDHDGLDLFPANWPYTVISQGSSYSDRAFLNALAMTLAAFRPDTRARLEETGLVAPTLQMILRRTQKQVRTPAAYLSGLAHPTVFSGENLAPARMIALANAIAPDAIPPVVLLDVLEEDFATAVAPFGLSEKLFDTPAAVARLWRAPVGRRGMTLSAVRTLDPSGRGLEFRWVLLRGDPTRVRIVPSGARNGFARVTIDWHDRRPVAPRQPRRSDRVDIAVFADNGAHLSAPSILSITFPGHQRRVHETAPDGAPVPVLIDYDAAGRGRDFDPLLWRAAPFSLTREGDGWTRKPAAGAPASVPEGG